MSRKLLITMTMFTWREVFRDFLSLFFSFAFPIMFMVIFGFTSQPKKIAPFKLGVTIEKADKNSENFIRLLEKDHSIAVYIIDRSDIEKALRNGSVYSALVISKKPGSSDENFNIINGNGTNSFLRKAVREALFQLNEPKEASAIFNKVTEEDTVEHSNFGTAFLIPGLTAMALMQLGLFGTANPIMIARARGTILHFLMTPMPKFTLVAAHVIVRLFIAALQITLLLGLAIIWLGVKMDAGLTNVLLIHALGAFMLISLGFLIAGNVPSESAGGAIVMIINFTMLGMCDIFYPTQSLPVLNILSMLLPLTYFADASRQLIVGNSGRFLLSTDIVVMSISSVIFFIMAVKTFKFGMKNEK